MPSSVIRQSVTFKVAPQAVYETLMDSRKHARFTGAAAKISRKVGGTIMAYDGYITGANIELIPDTKIVQTWHASDWPAGATSQVTFTLTAIPGGTRLTFTQRGVPAEHIADIKQGWIDNYWMPMQAMLNKAHSA